MSFPDLREQKIIELLSFPDMTEQEIIELCNSVRPEALDMIAGGSGVLAEIEDLAKVLISKCQTIIYYDIH